MAAADSDYDYDDIDYGEYLEENRVINYIKQNI